MTPFRLIDRKFPNGMNTDSYLLGFGFSILGQWNDSYIVRPPRDMMNWKEVVFAIAEAWPYALDKSYAPWKNEMYVLDLHRFVYQPE